jgi:hypothetical protein
MGRLVRMGFFDVPTVERKPWGILGLLLNLLPGIGSLTLGVKERHRPLLIRGVLQLVFFWLVLPWVWSIVDGVRIYRASAVRLTETPPSSAGSAAAGKAAKSAGDADYQPQCAALTEDGAQCRNSARGTSRYCSSHKGYQPPTAKALAQRIEGDTWSADDKLTDRKSVARADTKPVVGKAKDTTVKVRKAPKKAAKKAAKK